MKSCSNKYFFPRVSIETFSNDSVFITNIDIYSWNFKVDIILILQDIVPVDGSYEVKELYVQENKLDLAKADAETLPSVQIGKVILNFFATSLDKSTEQSFWFRHTAC